MNTTYCQYDTFIHDSRKIKDIKQTDVMRNLNSSYMTVYNYSGPLGCCTGQPVAPSIKDCKPLGGIPLRSKQPEIELKTMVI